MDRAIAASIFWCDTGTHGSTQGILHDARLPENVFVADASLFPRSLGNPPILTIIALAKRVARICAGEFAHRPLAIPSR